MSIDKLIKNKQKTLIKDYHVSNDEVYNIEDTYILKISSNIDRLRHEKEFNDLLINKLPVCKSIAFEIVDNKAYYLKQYIDGKNLCDESILSHPDRLIKILVNASNMIHSIKNENNESLVHGDLCLPNILINEKDGKYYINETEIDKTRYEFTKSSCTVSYTSSSYIDTMNNIVIADIKDYSAAKCKYYSSGSGSITIIKELVSTVNNVSYTHTQEIVYKDYMFISNEEEETNGDSKNIRTESVKYKAFINNPYK